MMFLLPPRVDLHMVFRMLTASLIDSYWGKLNVPWVLPYSVVEVSDSSEKRLFTFLMGTHLD